MQIKYIDIEIKNGPNNIGVFSHDAKSVDVKTYTRFSKLYPKYILI